MRSLSALEWALVVGASESVPVASAPLMRDPHACEFASASVYATTAATEALFYAHDPKLAADAPSRRGRRAYREVQ